MHEYSTGKTRRETFEDLGLKNVVTIPKMGVADKYALSEGHNAMRQIMPLCYFDAEKCDDGIEGLKSYRREWDEKKETFGSSPVQDWSKHFADAFRMLAWGHGLRREGSIELQQFADQSYKELELMEDQNRNWSEFDDYLS